MLEEKIIDYLTEEHDLEKPYTNTLHTRIQLLEEERIIQPVIAGLFHSIKRKGNEAAHSSKGNVEDAKTILMSTFNAAKWFYQTYSAENTDFSNVKFNPPKNPDARHALHELEKNYQSLEEKFNQLLREKEATQLSQEKAAEIKERSETPFTGRQYSPTYFCLLYTSTIGMLSQQN